MWHWNTLNDVKCIDFTFLLFDGKREFQRSKVLAIWEFQNFLCQQPRNRGCWFRTGTLTSLGGSSGSDPPRLRLPSVLWRSRAAPWVQTICTLDSPEWRNDLNGSRWDGKLQKQLIFVDFRVLNCWHILTHTTQYPYRSRCVYAVTEASASGSCPSDVLTGKREAIAPQLTGNQEQTWTHINPY